MDDEWIDIDALVAQQDPAAIAAARLSLAQSLADKLGFQLVPQKPTAALLRPFMECPDDELELAWQAMLHIAKVACTPSGSGHL